MSQDSVTRPPPRATCEDYEDEDIAEDTRTSANVAAKRSKPELLPKASYERRRNNGTDSGYASRANTVRNGSPTRNEKRVADLKVDTSFRERESRPYRYTATKTEARQSSNHPSTNPTVPKSAETKSYKHPEGKCWVCDKYGKHIDPPKGTPAPVSPTVSRRPSVAEDHVTSQTSQGQPRIRRTSSNRGPRPTSMYVPPTSGVLYETKPLPSLFALESPSYAPTPWHVPTTPLTVQYAPLTPVTYAQYPVTTASQIVTPVETQASYFHTLPPAKTRPAEPSRRASMYEQSGRPVLQPGKSTSTPSRPSWRASMYEQSGRPILQPPSREEKERTPDSRPPLRTQRSSQDRDNDRRSMPPPPLPQHEQVVLARRPSIKKAATSTSATAVRRHSQSYESDCDDFPRREMMRERKAEASLPPTSYRGPSAAISERPPNRKSVSYDLPTYSIEVGAHATSGAESLSRRLPAASPVERYEAEAEAYQRKRGTSDVRDLQSQSLTAEALRKVPRAQPLEARSETNSSQKSRNSSSKGSSGAKTGRSNPDITMRINGVALDIPTNSTQRITIQSKGVNISVAGKGRSSDRESGGSRVSRAPSIMSRTSKTNSSREKEKMMDRDDGRNAVGDDELRNPDRAGRRSQSISRYVSRSEEEEPIGYGA